jgi:hypothetical protein
VFRSAAAAEPAPAFEKHLRGAGKSRRAPWNPAPGFGAIGKSRLSVSAFIFFWFWQNCLAELRRPDRVNLEAAGKKMKNK